MLFLGSKPATLPPYRLQSCVSFVPRTVRLATPESQEANGDHPSRSIWLRQSEPRPVTELQVHVPTTYQRLRQGQLPLTRRSPERGAYPAVPGTETTSDGRRVSHSAMRITTQDRTLRVNSVLLVRLSLDQQAGTERSSRDKYAPGSEIQRQR